MKHEHTSIARTIFSSSDNEIATNADGNRRFMLHERARQIGYVKTDHLDEMSIEEAESHINFMASFSVASELIR